MAAATTRPQFASTSLYVGDLSPDVSETVLYEFFNSVGPVASIRVCRDSNSRKSLRYAYVNYHSIADAERALETLNHTPIKGNPCRIMWSQRDPTVRKSTSGNLFVRNLDRGVDSRALHDTFSLFGNILSCKVVADEQGRSKGYGFVHFESDEAAALAVDRVNGMKIGSKEVYVGPFQKRGERPNGRAENFTNVYTKSYPTSWDEGKLRSLFAGFGDITSIFTSTDSRGRPFACINYAEPDQARNAVNALNGKKVNNEGLLPEDQQTTAEDRQTTAAEDKQNTEDKQNIEDKADQGAADKAAEAEKAAETDKAEEAEEAEDGKADEAAAKRVDDADEDEVMVLYVDRAQDRAERLASLKAKHDRTGGIVSRNRYEGVNLYIKNLSDSVDDAGLRSLFEAFGTITSAKVMKDEDGHSKGFGFVCFTTPEEATKALAEMHLKLHDAKPLYVGLAEQKDRRQARLQSHFKGTATRTAAPAPQQIPPGVPTGFPLPPYFSQRPMGPWTQPPPFQGAPANFMWKAAAPTLPPMAPNYARPAPVATAARRAAPPTHMPEATNKQIIGEQLFPLVQKYQPDLAGKITGMMLDMDEQELKVLLESEADLKMKIDEAIRVLEKAAQQQIVR